MVANMPGAAARTCTFALNNATIGHAIALAGKGWKQALNDDAHLRNGLNVAQGNHLRSSRHNRHWHGEPILSRTRTGFVTSPFFHKREFSEKHSRDNLFLR